MSIDAAIVWHTPTSEFQKATAMEYGSWLELDAEYGDQVRLIDPAAGQSLAYDEKNWTFVRKHKPASSNQAAPILYSLDDVFSQIKNPRIKITAPDYAEPLEEWIAVNKGQFISVPVTSAAQMLEIQDTHRHENNLQNAFIASHGHVMRMQDFIVPNTYGACDTVFNEVFTEGPLSSDTPQIAAGLPHLFIFQTARSTRSDFAKGGLRSSPLIDNFNDASNPYIMHKLISAQNVTNQSFTANDELTNKVLSIDPTIAVLASPLASQGTGQKPWKILHWTIADPSTQISSLRLRYAGNFLAQNGKEEPKAVFIDGKSLAYGS